MTVQNSPVIENHALNEIVEDAAMGSDKTDAFDGIVGESTKMQDIFRLVERVADSDSTILINGETGTGKGLIAQAIHKQSYRRDQPFISINCGAIPENLLESELFGHVKGSFTGATANKVGKFEAANGGTIFPGRNRGYEPGSAGQDSQGARRSAASNRWADAKRQKWMSALSRRPTVISREEVQKGNFREDLFYRLYVIPIKLPALRRTVFGYPPISWPTSWTS